MMKTMIVMGMAALGWPATLAADPGVAGPGAELEVAKPRVKVISPNGGERFEDDAPIRVTWEASLGALARQRFWMVLIEKVTPVAPGGARESRIEHPRLVDWMLGGLEVAPESDPRKGRKFSTTLSAGTYGKDRRPRRLVPGQYKVTVFGVDVAEYRRLTGKGGYDSINQVMREAGIIDTGDRSFTVFTPPTPPAGRK